MNFRENMAQMDIFSVSVSGERVRKVVWELYVDGASRCNPGPAGIGIYLKKSNEDVLKRGYYLGKKTNNEAEYMALLFGVILALEYMGSEDTLKISSDSELIVKQVKGVYRVKKAELRVLHEALTAALAGCQYKIRHIFRSKNSVADALANEGIDKKVSVPVQLQKKLIKIMR